MLTIYYGTWSHEMFIHPNELINQLEWEYATWNTITGFKYEVL